MRRYMKLLIFVFFLTTVTISNVIASDKIDIVASSVVYLRQDVIKKIPVNNKQYELWLKDPNQNDFDPFLEQHAGTGLLLAVDNNHPYLVTAQHVASKMTATAKAVIRGPNDTPIILTLNDLVSDDKLEWFFHEHADVAVLPIKPSKSILKLLEKHCFPYEALLKDLEPPSRYVELVTIGFPLNLGVKGKFSPISRTSKAASGLLDLPRPDTKELTTFFLLEDPSVGGFSGSPVYALGGIQLIDNTATSGKLKCYGIVNGTMSDDTGGKFAAVVPAAFISEVILKAEKARRDSSSN